MKFFISVSFLLLSSTANSNERVFNLDDFKEKFDSGVTSTEYCNAKADISLQQAKDLNAPPEAQKLIKEWVSAACSLDIIAESKRVKKVTSD